MNPMNGNCPPPGQQVQNNMGIPGMNMPMYPPQNAPGGFLNTQQGIFYQGNGQTGFKVRPVASYDEAKAVPTDFMGNPIIMIDRAHGRIYTKVFNPNTGDSTLSVYIRTPDETQNPAEQSDTQPMQVQYDAKGEIDSLKAELEYIKRELGMNKEEQ